MDFPKLLWYLGRTLPSLPVPLLSPRRGLGSELPRRLEKGKRLYTGLR